MIHNPKWRQGEGEAESDDESVATQGDATTLAESEHMTDAETKSEAGLSEAERATPEPDSLLEAPPIIEEPEPEPEPPSPAPEELWEYLKETITHDALQSVDELVEKLVTTVSSIPQPYLKSVVKESIKKQKSIDEDESHHDGPPPEGVDGEHPPEQPAPVEGEAAPAPEGEAVAAPVEGASEGAVVGENPAGTPIENAAVEGTAESHSGDVPPAEAPSEAPSEPPAIQEQPIAVEAAA